MICTNCRLKNDHADGNQPDGSYLCFNCRPAGATATKKDEYVCIPWRAGTQHQTGSTGGALTLMPGTGPTSPSPPALRTCFALPPGKQVIHMLPDGAQVVLQNSNVLKTLVFDVDALDAAFGFPPP